MSPRSSRVAPAAVLSRIMDVKNAIIMVEEKRDSAMAAPLLVPKGLPSTVPKYPPGPATLEDARFGFMKTKEMQCNIC